MHYLTEVQGCQYFFTMTVYVSCASVQFPSSQHMEMKQELPSARCLFSHKVWHKTVNHDPFLLANN